MHKSVEARLSALEQRVTLLDKGETPTVRSPVNELLTRIGAAYLIDFACERLRNNPRSTDLDTFLGQLFECEITDKNRGSFYHKLLNLKTALVDKALAEFEKS